MPKIEQHVRKKVLWPLGIAFVGSLAIFLFVSNHFMENRLERSQEKWLQSVTSHYHGYMQERAGLMRSVLQQLSRDPAIIKALARKDRRFLLDHTTPLFNELLAEQHITHFYFHSPDGTNLLRVHKPNRFGDRIDRITLRLARQTDTLADGLELGPLGTFTLRVVLPIHDRKSLVGYIELGEDIDPILDHLSRDSDSKISVLIQKGLLSRDAWIEGRKMLAAPENWNQLPDHVISGFSDQAVVNELESLTAADNFENGDSFETIINNKMHRGRFLVLMDVGGRTVGSLLVLQDVQEILQNHRTSILLISLFCFLLVAFLFWIASTILGQADRNLRMISEQLREETSDFDDNT